LVKNRQPGLGSTSCFTDPQVSSLSMIAMGLPPIGAVLAARNQINVA
jgi:hypothetical protein